MDDNIINYNSGNMVIKDSKDTTIWSTNTKNKGVSPYSLHLQDDG